MMIYDDMNCIRVLRNRAEMTYKGSFGPVTMLN